MEALGEGLVGFGGDAELVEEISSLLGGEIGRHGVGEQPVISLGEVGFDGGWEALGGDGVAGELQGGEAGGGFGSELGPAGGPLAEGGLLLLRIPEDDAADEAEKLVLELE